MQVVEMLKQENNEGEEKLSANTQAISSIRTNPEKLFKLTNYVNNGII